MRRAIAALGILVGLATSEVSAQTVTCTGDGGCNISVTVNVSCKCCAGTPPVDAGTPPVDAGTPPVDAGTPPVDAGTPPVDAGTPPVATGWLHTSGNKILRSDNTVWMGKGVNLMDTRSCNACAYQAPNVNEVKRRADDVLNAGANFIRLDSESYASLSGRVHGLPPDQDAAYLADLVTVVNYIATRPDTYVLLSLWAHPSIGTEGRPTTATVTAWKQLAHTFRSQPRVMFGVVNEPENNYDGSGDSTVWTLMNDVVQGIRQQENLDGVPHHLVAVQGTGGWARLTAYYITHPIPSDNVIYETHIYNPQSDFTNLVTTPAATLPLIIGEVGPWPSLMTLTDTAALFTLANSLGVPWMAWTQHMRCSPNMLVDNSAGGCGIGMALAPTEWGNQVRGFLRQTTARLRR